MIFQRQLLPLVCTYWPESVSLGKQGRIDLADFHMPFNDKYVIEAKNCKKMELAKWWAETEVEAANKKVPFGVIVHKRRGFAMPEKQWATMPFGDWLRLVHG